MDILTGKQKRFLRAEAHHMKPIFQIGKQGLNETIIKEYEGALEKRELMKVSVLQNALIKADEAKEYIEDHSMIQVIQTIGHTLVLYQPSSDEKYQNYSLQLKKL